ncbi:expressed unknown protein [Seminavis robusta]|uniref:Uncharacterized protein n=1 Tax=Seminavis robusta TaxID=568900 RepID=A0A9N8F594_9STRA|nr:expressed unknown protein [Seminavis robusta]|eukprot:Sro3209_g345260.1 n/a (138) ;mRNA; f:6183-6596
MAFYGKLCALYTYLFCIIVPIGVLVAYFVMYWHEMPLTNKIVQPIIPIFFTAVDLPLYKACWKTSLQSYWDQDFGKGHSNEDFPSSKAMTVDMTLMDARTPLATRASVLRLDSCTSLIDGSDKVDQDFDDDRAEYDV